MVFSSLLFVFLFLTINLIIYSLVDDTKKNGVLLVFSLIFYAWGGPKYLLLLMGEVFVSWLFALKIEESLNKASKKKYLVLECVVLLGLLAVFKYTNFFCENLQLICGFPKNLPNIALPIGISFYTFQLLSYVIDVYRGEVEAQKNYGRLLLYAGLFHQCIAGPIVRYQTVAEEINSRSVSMTDLYVGVRRFSIGLAKKAILANGVARVADSLLPVGTDLVQNQSRLGLWVGMICYTLQIYLDFSAYSDMAIGMGRMVGFHYLENFNYPYIANSVQDFWRRWHISLSSFFRDYVYIPLGGSRCSKLAYIRNLTVVWFLTGMWHGASWNFIFWGLYYLLFLLIERFIIKEKIPPVLNHIYTMLVVVVGWTIFKFDNLPQLGSVLAGMFGGGKLPFTDVATTSNIVGNIFLIIFAIISSVPLYRNIRLYIRELSKENKTLFYFYNICEMLTPVILLFLSVLALIGASYNPFLYFRF